MTRIPPPKGSTTDHANLVHESLEWVDSGHFGTALGARLAGFSALSAPELVQYVDDYISSSFVPDAGARRTIVTKLADQSRVNNTLTDDTELTAPVVADGKWRKRWFTVYYATNVVPKSAFRVTLSGGAECSQFRSRAYGVTAGSSVASNFGINNTTPSGPTNTYAPVDSTGGGCLEIEVAYLATVAGTMTLQIAQNTTDAGNAMTVRAGSTLDEASEP